MRTFQTCAVFENFFLKSSLHLLLTLRRLLHGITELRCLVLLLHLRVDLLDELCPWRSLSSLACLGHYTYTKEICVEIIRLINLLEFLRTFF